ncbi:sulfhydryl oxidase 2 isoform X3 [Gouania willdenowi]|uniref:Sulfhydryl oxidase n=1 Tax=Gouania willdenowi TaxID=441366 RepID=A0A8C5G8K4_GOUWI|nr:sulfhydryl oxidase 2-like isoform X3 [Gouania willdenowi]
MFRLWLVAVAVLWAACGCAGRSARLYTEEDPLELLSSGSLKPAVINSSSAWIVQFFSSWCGHCIQYSDTWKLLAQDVKDWQDAIRVGVLDCAQEENFDVCKEFGIKFYPTFKYFKAHSASTDRGVTYRGADREIQAVRQLMVSILQNHTELERPQHCPALEPYRSAELLPLIGQRSDHYTAILVEGPDSFMGREVILDLLQFSGVQVKRALSSELPLLDTLKITTFPSVYLLQPNGSHTHLHSPKPLRFFFSSLLRSLPGVKRSSRLDRPSYTAVGLGDKRAEPMREFNSSQVYIADLEAALHYLLRVELATHSTLEGEELKVFKDFITLVSKLYPGGGSVGRLMETLSDWLIRLPLHTIPYKAVLDLLENRVGIPGVFLGAELRWIGCQGSMAGLRGYPCSLWTLFHVLTVQYDSDQSALRNTGLEGEAAPVLQVMRRYVRTFFGCEECGRHFERAAKDSVDQVENAEQQVLWLWEQHNRVNNRLAGSLSDDPLFPKAPWPSPSLCASCHEEKNGVHVWNRNNVLHFLRRHYGAANLSQRYSVSGPADIAPRHTSSPEREAEGRAGGGWVAALGFTGVDMSLCLLLYICSGLFLMLLFFFFKVRSRRWKLRYSRLPL